MLYWPTEGTLFEIDPVVFTVNDKVALSIVWPFCNPVIVIVLLVVFEVVVNTPPYIVVWSKALTTNGAGITVTAPDS